MSRWPIVIAASAWIAALAMALPYQAMVDMQRAASRGAAPPVDFTNGLIVWHSASTFSLMTNGALVTNWPSIAGWPGVRAERAIGGGFVTNGMLRNTAGLSYPATPTQNLSLVRDKEAISLVVVGRWTTNPATQQVLWQASICGANNARAYLAGGATSNRAVIGGRRLDTDAFAGVTSTNPLTTNMAVYIGVFASNRLAYYVNGAVDATSTWHTAAKFSDTQSNSGDIGIYVASFLASFEFAHVRVYETALSDAQAAQVANYFMATTPGF